MGSLLQMLKDYVTQFPDVQTFLFHKLIHVAAGAAVAAFVLDVTGCPFLGLVAAAVIGVAKEVSDQIRTRAGGYPEPISSSVLDTIVTTLGGVIVFLVRMHIG